MRILFIAVLFSSYTQLHGQLSCQRDRMGMSGQTYFSDDVNSRFTGQQIVGQSAISGTENGTFFLRQGFIQPIIPPGYKHSQQTESQIEVFPNPFKESFQLRIENPKDIRVTVYNALGQPVFSQQWSKAPLIDINLGNVPSGTYLIVLYNDNKKHLAKIQKIS